MQISKERLSELQNIILEKYSVLIPESDLLSETVRLCEFAKAVVEHALLQDRQD